MHHHIAILIVLSSLITGCATRISATSDLPHYPDHLERGRTLDIQVARKVTRIELTNTTAESFGPSRLWINMWFSHEIDGFEPGQTLRFNLYHFKDQHGESFRAGGFFATREPERVVLAELETDEGRGPTLLRLIVVGQTEGQR